MAKAPVVKEPEVNGEVEEEEAEEEVVVAPKAKKAKAPKRTKHPFMSEEAFEEGVRVYEEQFLPMLDEEQTNALHEISIFMRDTIGWKAWGRLVGTGNPKRD
jgi:hypothetical protein